MKFSKKRRAVVNSDEWLARYIVRKEHIRADGSLKADPFIPYKHVELSVTRHFGMSEGEIWEAGKKVALQIGNKLLGRGDAQTLLFLKNNLKAIAAPIKGNRNHANIVGWPVDKQSQKEIALELVKDHRVIYKTLPEAS